ncbi:TOMM precursor leader peptide-binding protein [Metabacillus sp. GX 13764]|uniref:TOMM precursor leader peptide-binding protein n=1 Tax=Metabacillus kandeliae TaxID=2900151 RepID=UPI001E54E281|nr:TOMM precursor leader peptide-binding protein [Metabacillus kandeliae]MCD7034205.1 TOMM precursor leader peptide-binding protein [Metabacillus kandeliae]
MRLSIKGNGRYAEFAKEHLSREFTIVQEEKPDALLFLQDSWDAADYGEAAREIGVPFITSHFSYGEGVVVKEGCAQCAETRKLMAGRDREQMHFLAERTGNSPEAWAGRNGMLQMVHLLQHVLNQPEAGTLHLMNLKTFSHSKHRFLQDPFCPVCGDVPEDTKEAAVIQLKANPKISTGSYRTRTLHELKEVLPRDYLDFRAGLFNGKMADLSTPYADVSVNLPLFGGDEGTAGRTSSYEVSELTAILEGLERYCGVAPRGKKTAVHSSYREIKDIALDPRSVGIHHPEEYEKPGFPFRPFDPERKMNWVWGYSFQKKEPVLVPELLAYYSLGCGHQGGFVYETSNGCAVGGSLEEAIFHGILEAAERDSFLLTWYAQLPLPRIDPRSSGDDELNQMLDRLQAVSGYELYLYQSTMEHGIPSIWTLMKNTKGEGLNLTCAAGAHLDPVKAVKSAVFELAGMLGMQEERLLSNKEKCLEMLKDSSLVRKMDDHGMLYGLKEAEERFSFLMDETKPMLTFAEAFPEIPVRRDLREDLEDVISRLHEQNLDVIVVDQTAPELAKNGLYCVKVLVPGLLPMTFGHHLRRIEGLERVLKVPALLGYRKEPLLPEELNPYPHPFP